MPHNRKSENSFAAGVVAPSEKEKHAEFTDKANAFLKWKTAGIPLKIGAKGALHNATVRSGRQAKRTAQAASDAAMLQMQQRPPTVKTANYQPAPQVKMSTMEKHTSKCGSCGMKMKKCACGDMSKAAVSLKDKVKEAFVRAINPTSAASSVDAPSGELAVKHAMGPTATKALRFLKKHPVAGQAAIWGTAGMASGAVGAPPGDRLRGAVRGGLTGAAGGAAAGGLMSAMNKVAAFNEHRPDPKDILAGKIPEKGLPNTALDQHVEDIKTKLLGTVEDYKDLKTSITSGPKERKVHLPRPPKKIMKALTVKEAGLKSTMDFLKDPAVLTAMGVGGALGGGGVYLANRPKKSLGGKSSAERDLETMVDAQKARGEEGASFPRRLKNRYVEFSKGLATDFRKSPGSAAAMGALTGATAGALAARMLGAGR